MFCRDCLQGAHLGPCLPCGGLAAPEEGGGVTAFTAGDPRAARATWLGADPSSVTIRVISKPCPNCRLIHLVPSLLRFSSLFSQRFFLVLLSPRPSYWPFYLLHFFSPKLHGMPSLSTMHGLILVKKSLLLRMLSFVLRLSLFFLPCLQGFGSGSVSGSVLDPYSIGPLDPDPDP